MSRHTREYGLASSWYHRIELLPRSNTHREQLFCMEHAGHPRLPVRYEDRSSNHENSREALPRHVIAPQIAVQSVFCYLSIDERLPGGPTVSASSYRISFLSHPSPLARTIHIYSAKIHGRAADQHKSSLSQNREKFQNFAPQMDPDVLQTLLSDA